MSTFYFTHKNNCSQYSNSEMCGREPAVSFWSQTYQQARGLNSVQFTLHQVLITMCAADLADDRLGCVAVTLGATV